MSSYQQRNADLCVGDKCMAVTLRNYRKHSSSSLSSSRSGFLKRSKDDDELTDSELGKDVMYPRLIKIIDKLLERTTKRSRQVKRKSTIWRYIDATVRLLVVIIGLVAAVLNFINGSLSIAILSYIAGAMILTLISLGELRDNFHFYKRSLILRECYHKFNQAIRELQVLKVSPLSDEEILDRIDIISEQIDTIDIEAFDIGYPVTKSRESLRLDLGEFEAEDYFYDPNNLTDEQSNSSIPSIPSNNSDESNNPDEMV